MDRHVLALLIPILALAIPVSAIVFSGLVKLARVKAEQAGGGELAERVNALEQEMGALRQELGDAQERLDFAERLLARSDEARRLS
jgi:hypothetical protein